MKFIGNLKIRTKIFTGFIIILVFASITGFVSSMSIIDINNRNKTAYESAMSPLEALMQVEVAFANVRQTSRGFIIRITADPTQLAKQEERLQGLLDTMSSSINTYIQTLKDSGANSETIGNSESVKSKYESEFKPMVVNMMNMAKSGDISQTVALLDATNTVSNEIYDAVQAIYKSTLEEISAAIDENSKSADRSGILSISLTVISLLACLVFATIISNSIVKPIKRLLGITEDLARGNLNVNRIETSKDEIGILVSDFFTVVETLQSLVDAMGNMSKRHNEGDIDAVIDTNRFEGVYKDMAAGVNGVVASYIDCIKEIINVISSIAEGQFEIDLQRYPGKKSTINTAIDNTKASFKGMSGEIQALAEAAGNGELSIRGNAGKYKGDWSGIIEDLNILLENAVTPIQEASSVLNEIVHGNLDAKITGDYKGDFALIKTSVNGMSSSISSYIRELSEVLTDLSNNNLDREITREYAGQFGAIKTSINLITNKLNSVMGEIGTASGQVSSGSKFIAESSMALAQGAAEQAGSVEDLTSTMDALNRQTHRNADNAKAVSDLSEVSKKNASMANSEMKQMLSSMDQIKESSNNISKIIKVIEDIAFQTNLLALNAAVEAARAGEHGKGFSVVAEEVRNLASRSQNAAKETNDLIIDSITKVNDGMSVALNTASSLDAIIRDSEQMSVMIGEITTVSGEQEAAISEIGKSLAEISHVIQANTSSSQEAASASEELASQSEVLKNMIAAFKLKK